MPINRALWKSWFPPKNPPLWPCPTCESGVLQLRNDSFRFAETKASKDAQKKPDWYPDVVEYTYSAIFDCINKSCCECVASCGQGSVSNETEYDAKGEPQWAYVDIFMPEYFFPHLNIFRIPEKCPQPVAQDIKSSFKLFFCDPASASNHIRIALESLMTDRGIKQYQDRKGKRKPLNLHQRIEIYRSQNESIAARLMAIKWIGNAGSHSGNITKDDVLDAYEILEPVLEELYAGYQKQITKKIALINRRRKPVHSK